MSESMGELIERLAARGERIVIIGKGDPMVLLPLTEYEKLTSGQFNMINGGNTQNTRLEPVDIPSGMVSDDDQYFPEPL